MRNSAQGTSARTSVIYSFHRPSYGLTSDTGDLSDRLALKLGHAEALSYLLCGERGEAFRDLAGEIQDNIAGLLSELLQECRATVIAMHDAQARVAEVMS